jgi:hypothetical protein
MEDCRSHIIELQQDDDDDSSDAQAPQGSLDIHKSNLSMKSYIMLLKANGFSANAVVCEAATLGKYVPLIPNISPLASMITEITYYLEDKLVKVSKSFPDQGLRFLFLLNNSYFMLKELHQHFFIFNLRIMDLNFKVNAYMKSYLQQSWAPVVSCLFESTPLRLFGKKLLPAA